MTDDDKINRTCEIRPTPLFLGEWNRCRQKALIEIGDLCYVNGISRVPNFPICHFVIDELPESSCDIIIQQRIIIMIKNAPLN